MTDDKAETKRETARERYTNLIATNPGSRRPRSPRPCTTSS